jgi:hypothetical protein
MTLLKSLGHNPVPVTPTTSTVTSTGHPTLRASFNKFCDAVWFWVILPQRIVEGIAVSIGVATLLGVGRLFILARKK